MASKTKLKQLFLKQKAAIRIIDNAHNRDHTNPIFTKYKILPLNEQIKLEILKFMHNFHNKKQPLSFADTWTTNQDRNTATVLRNNRDYYVHPHRVDIFARSPVINFAKIWNNAAEIKYTSTLQKFLSTTKENLLNSLDNNEDD